MKKNILDDPIRIRKLDPQNMLSLVRSVPQQCRDARKEAVRHLLKIDSSPIDSIMICGVGGSAMSGEMIASYLRLTLKIPVMVVRDYDLPAWAGSKTLLICSSYSGDTEETLSVFKQALSSKMKMVILTSGGTLLKEVRKNNLPHFVMPPGVQPRAMVNYSFITLLTLLEKLKLLPSMEKEIDEAIAGLEKSSLRYGVSCPVQSNLAKQLAEFYHKKIPVLYAGESFLGAVAYRWKCQLNENAKQMMHVNFIPEMNHNEILAYTYNDLFLKNAAILLLRSKKQDHPRVQKRFDIFKKMLALKTKNVKEVWAEGDSLLSETLGMVYLGDFVSVYLALLKGINPTSIDLIDQLKNDLRK